MINNVKLLLKIVDLIWLLKFNYVIIILSSNGRILEEYPSLAEGTGLENRKVGQPARGFESLFLRHFDLSRDGAVW